MEPDALPDPSSSGPCGTTPTTSTAGLHPDGLLLDAFALPLLLQLQRWHQESLRHGRRRPLIGLNGPVGAGKSTLGRQLEALAPRFGLRLVVASIDDLYLSWPERGDRLAGNPFGVSRVPPGSHDVPLLLEALHRWRSGEKLRLPRFDKTLAHGQGDRDGWRLEACDAVVLEGWLVGCRPLAASDLAVVMQAAAARASEGPLGGGAGPGDPLWSGQGAPVLHPQEWQWLPHWNQELAHYLPLWSACDGLWLLRPEHWGLPRRWRFQAEARQRRHGGGWLSAAALDALVRASLCSLPPSLYQDPLLRSLPAEARPHAEGTGQGWGASSPAPSVAVAAGNAEPSDGRGGERRNRLAGPGFDRTGPKTNDPGEAPATRGHSCDALERDPSIRSDRAIATEWAGGHDTARSPATTPEGALAWRDGAVKGGTRLGNHPDRVSESDIKSETLDDARARPETQKPRSETVAEQGSCTPARTGTTGDLDPDCGPPVQAVAWLDGRRRCLRVWRQPSASLSSSATG